MKQKSKLNRNRKFGFIRKEPVKLLRRSVYERIKVKGEA